jgi:hypothetical protein
MPGSLGFSPLRQTHIRNYLKSLMLVTIIGFAPQAALRALAQAAPESRSAQTAAPSQGATPVPSAVKPDDVVLSVGNFKMTAKEFETLTANLPPDVASALPSLGKRGFAERYANMLGLAQEGEKLKVDQSENFRAILAFQRMMLLAQITINQLATSVGDPSPEEVSSFYKAHESEFQQVKVRGIFVSFAPEGQGPAKQPAPGKTALTEAQAKAKAEGLRDRIRGGEDMAALAKKESEHSTAAQGGDFGYVRHNQYPAPIDSAIFSLDLSKVSDPVRDRFGYYIFRVEEKRVQPLGEEKQTIENGLRQQKLGETLGKVQAEFPANLNSQYFGEPAQAPSMLGTPSK